MNVAGLAVGDLTHGLAVAGVPIVGLSFGTTMQAIFNLIGPGYSLVTVDGRSTNCAAPPIGISAESRAGGRLLPPAGR